MPIKQTEANKMTTDETNFWVHEKPSRKHRSLKRSSLKRLPRDGSAVQLYLSRPESIALVRGLSGVTFVHLEINSEPHTFFDLLIQAGLGYIERLELTLARESGLEGIEFFDRLIFLRVAYNCQVSSVLDLSLLQHLPSLETLAITLYSRAELILNCCQMLQELYINSIKDYQVNWDAGCPNPASKITIRNSSRLVSVATECRDDLEIDLDMAVNLEVSGDVPPLLTGQQPACLLVYGTVSDSFAMKLGNLQPLKLDISCLTSDYSHLDLSCLESINVRGIIFSTKYFDFLTNAPNLKTIELSQSRTDIFLSWNETLPKGKRFEMARHEGNRITYAR